MYLCTKCVHVTQNSLEMENCDHLYFYFNYLKISIMQCLKQKFRFEFKAEDVSMWNWTAGQRMYVEEITTNTPPNVMPRNKNECKNQCLENQ